MKKIKDIISTVEGSDTYRVLTFLGPILGTLLEIWKLFQ